jgi:hypothetical protein
MDSRKLKLPRIPKRISSKIPAALQRRISEAQQHKASHTSRMANFSVASSSVADFLQEKTKSNRYDYDYLAAQIRGLQSARETKFLDGRQYGKEAAPLFDRQSEIGRELTLLTNQQKVISEDIEDEVAVKKRRGNDDEPDIEFFERAYAATIVPKIMSATASQLQNLKRRRFDTTRFREAVLGAYNAENIEAGGQLAWCHISGDWYESDLVKAAHLVPKILSPGEFAYLFGIREASDDFFYDWRLG